MLLLFFEEFWQKDIIKFDRKGQTIIQYQQTQKNQIYMRKKEFKIYQESIKDSDLIFASMRILYFFYTFKSKFSNSRSPHSIFVPRFQYWQLQKSSNQYFVIRFQTPFNNFYICFEDRTIPKLLRAFSAKHIQLNMSSGQFQITQYSKLQLKDTPLWLELSSSQYEQSYFLERTIFQIEGISIAEQAIYFSDVRLRALINPFLLSEAPKFYNFFRAFRTFFIILVDLSLLNLAASEVEKLNSLVDNLFFLKIRPEKLVLMLG